MLMYQLRRSRNKREALRRYRFFFFSEPCSKCISGGCFYAAAVYLTQALAFCPVDIMLCCPSPAEAGFG